MAMKPEDALQAIAAARGDAICVPTMTTSPAWRAIAPDDLSIHCQGFMGGASTLGLGLALSRPERPQGRACLRRTAALEARPPGTPPSVGRDDTNTTAT